MVNWLKHFKYWGVLSLCASNQTLCTLCLVWSDLLLFEATFVHCGVDIGPQLRSKHIQLETPVVVSDESELLFAVRARFVVKEVSAADKGFFMGNVAVHAVYSHRPVIAVYCHSLVEPLLVLPKHAVIPLWALFTSLYNFNCVRVNLFDGLDSHIWFIQLVLPGPARGLSPSDSATKVVFGDYVFVCFKSEAHVKISLVLLSIVSSV